MQNKPVLNIFIYILFMLIGMGGTYLVMTQKTPSKSGHHGHGGHDHGSDHSGHDHGDHAGHDHGSDHSGHDHGDHVGHDHGSDHSGHDHGDHADHDHGSDHSGHDHGDHAGHDHGSNHNSDHSGHGHDETNQVASQKLSPQALKNLKLKTKKIKLGDYTTYKTVNASIGSTAKTIQPITAPINGIVKSIHIEHGEMVEKNSALITLMREAMPRPDLKLTGFLMSAEQKLKGLNASELADLKNKKGNEKQSYLIKKALEKHGYWSRNSDLILRSLPSKLSKISYAISLIGELSANGYLTNEMVLWLSKDKKAAEHFFDISSLILKGESLSTIKSLLKIGAFESQVTIKTPEIKEDYDVHRINIKIGERVVTGQKLGELHDMRELHLEAHARGSEISLLMNALEKGFTISSVPLAMNSGVVIDGLKIRSIQDDSDRGGAKVHIEINDNPAVIKKGHNGKKFRSWKIRVGTRYILRVPTELYENIYTIPCNAVIDDGPEKQVFIKENGLFKVSNVVVLHQNEEVAVLGIDSDLKVNEELVTHGAFGLSLALKAQRGEAIDPHAGHSH